MSNEPRQPTPEQISELSTELLGECDIPTSTRLAEFLLHLREVPNVTRAAALVGLTPGSVRYHKKSKPEFSRLWEEAVEQSIDLMEQIAHAKAFYGTAKPIIHQGQPTYQRDFTAQVVDPDTGLLKYVEPHEAPFKRDTNGDLIPMVVHEMSDALITFLLKAHRPEKYRERSDVNVTGSIDIASAILDARKRHGAG